MLRICLIIAILAGVGTAVVNFVTVKEKINNTLTERDDYHKKADQEAADHKKFQKLATETQTKLDSTTKELADAKTERDAAVTKSGEDEKRALAAIELQKKTLTERDNAKNDLAAWLGLGIPIEHIKETLASLNKVIAERDVVSGENKVLLGENNRLQEKINSILDPEYEVKLPKGLKGTVLIADPKYDFVLLNIGQQQGVLEAGKMLVSRHGQLVAKVQIKSVSADRAIANVLPGYKKDDIMEGDQVIY